MNPRRYEDMTLEELMDVLHEQDFLIACYEDEIEVELPLKDDKHASRCSHWLWLDDPDTYEYCDCLLQYTAGGEDGC